MLVYSTDVTCAILIEPKYDPHPEIQQGVYATNRKLIFLADLSNLDKTKIVDVSWNFDDGEPKSSGLSSQMPHSYGAPGNYSVKCIVKFQLENTISTLTLYKTVVIMDPPP